MFWDMDTYGVAIIECNYFKYICFTGRMPKAEWKSLETLGAHLWNKHSMLFVLFSGKKNNRYEKKTSTIKPDILAVYDCICSNVLTKRKLSRRVC